MLTLNSILQNRYRIVRLAAKGGMGAVYEAVDTRLAKTVAVKQTFFADEKLRRAFEREALLLAKLSHPALPKVGDHFFEGAGQFLVMDFISGEDLFEILTRLDAPLPVGMVMDIGDQVLDALEYLHSQTPPVIHRDIKPHNLKVTPEGRVYLLDFGLARQAGSSIAGYSVNYAPPEQLERAGTDTRSDLYSLGVALHHVLTNQVPPTAITRVLALNGGEPDPLRPAGEFNPSVSFEMSLVLQKAASLDLSARFSSVREMRNAWLESRRGCRIETKLDGASVAEGTGTQSGARPERVAHSFPPPPAPMPPETRPRGFPETRVATTGAGAGARLNRFTVIVGCLLAAGVLLGAAALGFRGFEPSKRESTEGRMKIAPMPVEVLRYGLEVNPDGKSSRWVSGTEPLSADDSFRFHFFSPEGGFLYVLAPEKRNITTTFLTSEPLPESGVATNRIPPNSTFEFPSKGASFGLRKDTHVTTYTVIFSPVALEEPGFLATRAGHELTPSEQADFLAFCATHVGKAQITEQKPDSGLFMSVRVPAERKSEPAIFDIVVRLKT